MERWRAENERVQWEKGKQEITQCLSQSERRLQWRQEKERGREESGLVFWAGWSAQGR